MFKPYEARGPRAYVWANRFADATDAWPGLFNALQRRRLYQSGAAWRIVSPAHLIVIEGFPRSGNSFAHKAFQRANPAAHRRIATHQHRSSQVRKAEQHGVPILVLLRAPEPAVTSLLAFAQETGQLSALSPAQARGCLAETLRRYIRFHRRIAGVERMLVARFEQATRDFGAVTERLNATFGTDFAAFDHSEANVAALFADTRAHLSPSADRDRVKTALAEAYHDPALANLRQQADAAYAVLAARTGDGTPLERTQ